VAYAKLGRPEDGISLLEQVLQQHPDRYETLSNLGTLLFFSGRLDESKTYIRRALEIDPEAHFGRERYQLLLTEYLQQSNYATTGIMRSDEAHGFHTYVLKVQPLAKPDETKKATTGVLGMLHFANFESPILLEALGDLLRQGSPQENGTQLAARAYLRAAQMSESQAAAEAFRKKAHDALSMHEDYGMHNRRGDYLAKLDKTLTNEMADAEKWFSSIEANERRWIAENRDVDREFAAAYYDSLEKTLDAAGQKVQSEWYVYRPPYYDRLMFEVIGLVCALPLGVFITGMIAWAYWRRRKKLFANDKTRTSTNLYLS
jgi:tetratricopeptide (TPR) repeat protein